MQLCVLASGSSGNCTLVSSGTTSILVDAGLSGRETAARLSRVGLSLDRIHAVCVSHEHNDHTAGLRVLHRKHRIPVYANSATVEALRRDPQMEELEWRVFSNGTPFAIGDIFVEPFDVPHDASDPVGFIVRAAGVRVGVVTDMGVATGLIRERLRRCHVVVVESNHDEQMLKDANRPWHLKQRILGRQGHLSNQAAGEMIASVAGPDLQHVFLAHMSKDCNRPELALGTVRRILEASGHARVKVSCTYADRISEIWDPAQGLSPSFRAESL